MGLGTLDIQEDPATDDERSVFECLEEHNADLSDEAIELLNLVEELYEESFPLRATYIYEQPRYQVNSWDAGWVQISRIIFGKDRINDSLLHRKPEFQQKLRALGDKIPQAAYEDGVI